MVKSIKFFILAIMFLSFLYALVKRNEKIECIMKGNCTEYIK